MLRILLLSSLVLSQLDVFSQAWVYRRISNSCEAYFPTEPENFEAPGIKGMYADTDGVRVMCLVAPFTAEVEIADEEDLRKTYRETLNGAMMPVKGTIGHSEFDLWDDLLVFNASFTIEQPHNSCQSVFFFAKDTQYSFQACATPDNPALAEVSEEFFQNISINKALTSDDQRTAHPDEFTPETMRLVYIGLGIIGAVVVFWIILLVMAFRRPTSPRSFPFMRWTVVAIFLGLAALTCFATLGNLMAKDPLSVVTIIQAGVFVAIALVALFLKPKAPKNP